MSKIPSVKRLLYLVLVVTIIVLSYSYIGWANLLDEAKEYRVKADRLHNEGKLDQAIDYYHKTLGLDKYCLAAYNGLAICYEKKGLFSRAETWYLRALEVNPQYAPAHYNLGLLYEKFGKIEKAIYHWKQRMRLGRPAEPGYIKARAKLKQYAPHELKDEDARELVQRIEQQKEKDALDKILGRNKYRTKEEVIQEYYLKGMRSYNIRDYRGAADYFHKMIETLPFSN